MLIKRTITEYLDLDEFDWVEDLKYWLELNNILDEQLTCDLFMEYINSTYDNGEFKSHDCEMELEDNNFEDIYNEYIKRNND